MKGAGEAQARMRAALAALPREEAEVFGLHVAGVEFAAIADRLGIAMDEVERRLAAALVSLDRSLREEGSVGGGP